MTTKPFKITQTGKYRQRNGALVTVHLVSMGGPYPIGGSDGEQIRYWRANGRAVPGRPSDHDIVRRWSPRPSRKRREAVRYEVVIRSPIMTTKAKASEIAARAQAVVMISHNCRVSIRRAARKGRK